MTVGPYLYGLRGPGAWSGSAGEGDPGFPEPPIVTDVNGDVTINGKVKPGSFGKFVYPLATIAASRQYTFRTVANFSQLAKQGNLAMVGFGLKNGNDFHIAGLRGDGAGGTDEYIVHGTPPNGWNKQTGHTEVDNGAAGAGTQHSAYYRLITSSDGTTYTLKTSTDGVSYTTVETGRAPSPFTNVSGVTTFGVALWFNNTDAGPFTIQITLFADEAAATWTPATDDLGSSMSLWFDPGDESSVTHASNVISQVNDKSGNALHITPASTRNPTFVPGDLNSLGTISFDGGDNLRKTSGVSPTVPGNVQTVFVIARTANATNGNVYWTTNGSTVAGVITHATTTMRFQGNSGNYAEFDPPNDAWHLYSGYINTASRQVFLDGVSQDTDSTVETSATRPTQIWFGSDSNPVSFYTGKWAEFLQYDGILSQADREKVEGYMAHRWGLQGLLDAGHPYKSSPP